MAGDLPCLYAVKGAFGRSAKSFLAVRVRWSGGVRAERVGHPAQMPGCPQGRWRVSREYSRPCPGSLRFYAGRRRVRGLAPRGMRRRGLAVRPPLGLFVVAMSPRSAAAAPASGKESARGVSGASSLATRSGPSVSCLCRLYRPAGLLSTGRLPNCAACRAAGAVTGPMTYPCWSSRCLCESSPAARRQCRRSAHPARRWDSR
jgi:hypothetical protein